MSKKFVFFDLGNVLVNFDHEIAVRQLAELSARPIDRVRDVLFTSGLQNRYETGLVTSLEFAAIVNRELQCETSRKDVLEAISAIFEPNESILDALELLRSMKVAMGVLSNTCEAHWQWLKRRPWPMLGEWFETCILSYEARSMKPDEQIYRLSEQASGRRGADIFFMDDRIENVAGATKRGWVARQYRHTGELIEQLRGWLHADMS